MKQASVNSIIGCGKEWGNPPIPQDDSLHPLSKSLFYDILEKELPSRVKKFVIRVCLFVLQIMLLRG